LSYDARHTFNVNADYRFGEGKNYNGPKWFNTDVFANTGLNLTLRGRTGTPYSRQANPTPDAQFGVQARSLLEGAVNGSRLPFNFVLNARVDKDFKLPFGQKEGASPKYINVYLLAQNLLNRRNIISVYPYTGNPEDDGYVTSGEGQEVVAAQVNEQAFLDQYQLKIQNPNNYSIPRRIRLGLLFNF